MDAKTKAADEISLKEVVLIVRKVISYLISRWKLIIFCGIIGAAIGLIYSFLKKPIYKAEFSFALEDNKSGGGLGAYAGIASQFGLDVGGSSGGIFSDDNLPELMRSRFIIQKVLLDTVEVNGHYKSLADLYIEMNGLDSKWKGTPLQGMHFPLGEKPERFSLKQDSLLQEFHQDIIEKDVSVVKKDKKLTIITATVLSTNELFSKNFAERLVQETSSFYIDTKTKKSADNVAVLKHQTDSVRNALNDAIRGFASKADVNPNPNPALQILRVPSLRSQVDVEANKAILSELVKNLEISKVSLRKETPLIQKIDTPILPLPKERFGKAKGLMLGGVLGVIIMVVLLVLAKGYKHILKND